MEKQGTLFFGSKEEKQKIIKDILKQSQENGVDVKNVTVSKDIWSIIKNTYDLTDNFLFGWVKCTLVPDSVKSFTTDQIIAKASPLVGQVKFAMDELLVILRVLTNLLRQKKGCSLWGI